jgi:hypothetical protein
MPFTPATGEFGYTNQGGATGAFPGEVIASATWNQCFTDIQNALTQLGQQQLVQSPRIITLAGPVTVANSDRIILIEAPVGTIVLGAATAKVNPVTIIGGAGSIFGSNNAVLLPYGGDTIDGLSSTTLTGNYQSITLLPLAAGGWLVY